MFDFQGCSPVFDRDLILIWRSQWKAYEANMSHEGECFGARADGYLLRELVSNYSRSNGAPTVIRQGTDLVTYKSYTYLTILKLLASVA
jgi:hypothetical protein